MSGDAFFSDLRVLINAEDSGVAGAEYISDTNTTETYNSPLNKHNDPAGNALGSGHCFSLDPNYGTTAHFEFTPPITNLTAEFWYAEIVNPDPNPLQVFDGWGENGGEFGLYTSPGSMYIQYHGSDLQWHTVSLGGQPTTSTWIVIQAEGATLSVYVGGVRAAYVTTSATAGYSAVDLVGPSAYSSYSYTGKVDEFRVTSAARYTGATILVQSTAWVAAAESGSSGATAALSMPSPAVVSYSGATAALSMPSPIVSCTATGPVVAVLDDEYLASVTLLAHFDGGFTDSSPSARILTPTGAVTNPSTYKFGGGALQFGNSSRIDTPIDYRIQPTATGDFTLEMFVNPISWADGYLAYCVGEESGFYLKLTPATSPAMFVAALVYIAGSTDPVYIGDDAITIAPGEWHHISLTRAGTRWTIYVDGSESAYQDISSDYAVNLSDNFTIGYPGSYRTSPSYIDELRITSGIARYTSNFTPPEAPFQSPSVTGPIATVRISAPDATLMSSGGFGATVSAPPATVASYGGASLALTLPTPKLTFRAHQSYGENAVIYTLPKPTLSAWGGGTARLTSPRHTLSASLTITNWGKAPNLRTKLPLVSATGTGGAVASASVVTPSATLTAYGGGTAQLAVSVSLTASVLTGGVASASLKAPKLKASAKMFVGGPGSADLKTKPAMVSAYGGGQAEATIGSPTLEAYGGVNAALVAPSASVLTTVFFGVVAASAITAPTPTISVYCGGDAQAGISAPSVSCWGGVNAGITSPSAVVTSSATRGVVAGADLRMRTPTLIGYGGAVCSVTLAGRPTVAATGTTGSTGGAALTLPLFELVATGTVHRLSYAELICPAAQLGAQLQAWLVAPTARLVAIGSATATVSAAYEAYAVNLKHTSEAPADEVTHYTNFPFTHVVRYKNSYYGANTTGLYLLEGTTDAGTAIPFAVKTHETDFDSPQHKTVVSAYFGGRIGPAETISLQAGETPDLTYQYATPRGAKPQSHRQVFGKGLKARYYALGVSGVGEFALDSVDLEIATMKRRI